MYYEEFEEVIFQETSYINFGEFNSFTPEVFDDSDNSDEILFI